MNNILVAYFLLVIVGIMAGFSQIMLKVSAKKEHPSFIREYLNAWVIGSYIILFATTFLNMIALQYLPFKVVSAFTCLPYVIVVLLSRFILKERISSRRWAGLAAICVGIIVFNL